MATSPSVTSPLCAIWGKTIQTSAIAVTDRSARPSQRSGNADVMMASLRKNFAAVWAERSLPSPASEKLHKKLPQPS